MKVLIACEFSGIVRDAFIRRGHDAVSCDLLPTERPGPHIQDDVLKHLDEGWDLMIAHPPCQFLSYAGHKYWDRPGRDVERQKAMSFFMALYNSPIPKVCVENPLGLPHKEFRPPDQTVNPFDFGDKARKRTCFWLKHLPPLSKLNHKIIGAPAPIYVDKSGKKRHATEAKTGSGGGWKKRSTFWPGIAEAMADQWGSL